MSNVCVIPGPAAGRSPESVVAEAGVMDSGLAASRRPGMTPENASKLSEARLQAVSSRNMYSEQGLEAMIGPDAGQVCQSLMVVWNWMPGSAQAQAALPISSQRSRAFSVLATEPSLRKVSCQSASASTALRN